MKPDDANAGEVTRVMVEAFGVIVPIHASGGALSTAVADVWRDAFTQEPPTTEPVVAAGDDILNALHDLSPAVTRTAINAMAGDLVMLHAAALADLVTGRTVVMVAPSGTGKTTAAVKLGKRFAYLTDETAAITQDGVVLPYRKPLSIIDGGPFKTQTAPSELGLMLTDRECTLGALVIIDRDPEHSGTPVVELLDTVDGIAALAPQSSFLPSLRQPLHQLANLMHLVGGVHRVTYAESADLEAAVVDLLDLVP